MSDIPDQNHLFRCQEALERGEMPAPDDLRYALHAYSAMTEWARYMVAEGKGEEYMPIPNTMFTAKLAASIKYTDLTQDIEALERVMLNNHMLVIQSLGIYNIYNPETTKWEPYNRIRWTLFDLVKRAIQIKWDQL